MLPPDAAPTSDDGKADALEGEIIEPEPKKKAWTDADEAAMRPGNEPWRPYVGSYDSPFLKP